MAVTVLSGSVVQLPGVALQAVLLPVVQVLEPIKPVPAASPFLQMFSVTDDDAAFTWHTAPVIVMAPMPL